MLNFTEQVNEDLNNVFFNTMEFAEPVKISCGSIEHTLDVVIDNELYEERRLGESFHGVQKAGLLFFVKKTDWINAFRAAPMVTNVMVFAGRRCQVEKVNEDNRMFEITLDSYVGV